MALQVSTPQVIVLTPHTKVLTRPRQSPTEYVPNCGGHTPNRLLDACDDKMRLSKVSAAVFERYNQLKNSKIWAKNGMLFL